MVQEKELVSKDKEAHTRERIYSSLGIDFGRKITTAEGVVMLSPLFFLLVIQMEDDLVIKKESLPILKKIFGRMEADAKMIDGWKRGWQVDRIDGLEAIYSNLFEMHECLEPLRNVGIILPEVNALVGLTINLTKKLLGRERSKLEIMDG